MDVQAIETNDLELVDEVLDRAAEFNPDIEAYVEPSHEGSVRSSVTFLEWKERSVSLAAELFDRGVRKGDVVGLLMGPSIDYAVAYQAVLRVGAVLCGMNPRLGKKEQASIFERMRPRLSIIEDALVEEVDQHSGPILARSEMRALPHRAFLAVKGRSPSDFVAVVWTSGTTGLPKGALFSHDSLRSVARGTDVLSQRGDRKLSPLPFAHIGYMTRVWDEISNGVTTIITPTPWSAKSALRSIVEERVSVAQGVPTQWALILELDESDALNVSSLRITSTGAARMAPSQVAALRKRFRVPVVVRYTSTEASLGTGTVPGDSDDVVATTVGRPVPGVEMELRDDHGRTVASGEVGRVHLKSGAAMLGYVATRQVDGATTTLQIDEDLTRSVRGEDGWIMTGDFGVVDIDGNLSLVGRDNELYQRGGYNVYPAEVEQVLDSVPGIGTVAIVPGRDDVLGEIGVAFIVPEPGEVEPSRESIRASVGDTLADYKLPDVVILMDELPVTAMGKIDKRSLKRAAQDAAAQRGKQVKMARESDRARRVVEMDKDKRSTNAIEEEL